MLPLRALFAFLVLPGMVAGFIPAWITAGTHPYPDTLPVAVGLLALGGVLLLWCVRDFFVAGKGTLAPWDPPKHLVVVGLYRYVRNPMYLAVLTVVSGWSVLFHSSSLAVYLAVVMIAFHLRVILYEEPRLRSQFGAEWDAYSKAVSRWLPRPVRQTR